MTKKLKTLRDLEIKSEMYPKDPSLIYGDELRSAAREWLEEIEKSGIHGGRWFIRHFFNLEEES